MNNYAYLLPAAFIVGAVGTIPMGIINMNIMSTAIKRGMAPAFWMGIGAALVEAIQIFIAITFIHIFLENALYKDIFTWIVFGVLVITSIYYFRKRNVPIQQEKKANIRSPFLRGMFVSSLNFMAIPYWAFYGAWLGKNNWLDFSHQSIALTALSAVSGAMIIFYFYAKWGHWISQKWNWIGRRINLLLGYIFAVLAVVALLIRYLN